MSQHANAHFRATVCLAIVCLTGGASSASASLLTGLTGYWKFDASGADSSGAGRDLDLFGGVGFAAGLDGSALDLHKDGTQFAQRPVVDAVYDFGAGDFTVQTWVNFNSIATEGILIEKFGITDGWTLGRGLDPHMYMDFPPPPPTPGGGITTGPMVITTGVWHHVIVRRAGSTFNLFYDGALAASETYLPAILDSAAPLLVGRRTTADARDLSIDGRLDETAIWSRALSDPEIESLYNNGAGLPIPEPSTLVLAAMSFVGLVAYGLCQRRR